MTQMQIILVKSTWAKVAEMDQVIVGGVFYERLFELAPQLRPMFRSPIPAQSKKLIAMLNYVVAKLDKLDSVLDEVSKLGRKHIRYGVKPAHYLVVGEALLWTLKKGLADNWNKEVEDAWVGCYTTLSRAMIDASETQACRAA